MIPETWKQVLSNETIDLGERLEALIAERREAGETIYPPQDQLFRALNLTPPEELKVCIIGQDPYHEEGQANGLAFSVSPGTPLPRSLRNIFKELGTDLGVPFPSCGDLTPWARQGVLLLNTVLSVRQGAANSHARLGWQKFTHDIFSACVRLPQPVVFILWGGQARKFVADLPFEQLEQDQKYCICSSHPSPLGAMKGNAEIPAFIGSRPFSKANELLERMGAQPVSWNL